MTLSTYAALFDGRDHADKMAAMLEASFGNVVETAARGEAHSVADGDSAEVAPLRPIAGERG